VSELSIPRKPVKDEGAATRGFATVLKRHWWAILIVVAIVTAAAFALSDSRPTRFRAASTLIYQGEVAVGSSVAVQVQNVNALMGSPGFLTLVSKELGRPLPPTTAFSVSSSAVPVESGGQISTVTPSNLASITVESSTAELSAELANAYADAFVVWRTELTRAQASAAAKSLRAQLAAFKKPRVQGSADKSLLASAYVELSQRLSEYLTTARSGTGGYRVVSYAPVPTEPFAPRPLRSSILGFMAGLAMGIALAFVLENRDTRLDGEQDVVGLLGLPVIGRVASVTRNRASGAEPPNATRESYRRVSFQLLNALISNNAQALLFTSSCEGEGTSIVVSEIALSLARTGKRVAVVDANLREPAQHAHFGLPNDQGLSTVALKRSGLEESLQPVVGEAPSDLSLHVLTGGPPSVDPGDIVGSAAMGDIIDALRERADIVLVDCPALQTAADAIALASRVDAVVLLVDTDVASRPALRECSEILSRLPCRKLGVVIASQPDKESMRFVRHRIHRRLGKEPEAGGLRAMSTLARDGTPTIETTDVAPGSTEAD
jgi:capsular exopolysaccharide synthesis family protein